MRFDMMKSLALAATFAAPMAVSALYGQGVQPYNPQDPQNYGTPATQSYGSQYPQQPPQYGEPQYPQQPQYGQPQYPQQQPQYGQPQYPQQQQQPQYGAPQGQYPQYATPDQGYPDQGMPQGGQEQIYQAPPPLPQYDQPPAPGDGYIWTPGYWAFGPSGYYWVPGTWVLPPYDGALWTPGYWDDGAAGYDWNPGYWGPVVGFYGGINYGFGYFGVGFYGGCWRDHRFWYNREYSHVGGYSHNVYSQHFNGISNARPGGRSFTTVSAHGGAELHGGPGAYGGASRGFAAPGQAAMGHPAYPGSTYSSMNRGYAAPVQRYAAPMAAPRAQGYSGGGYARPSMPMASAPHYSAPAAPHYSAPSGGGGGGGFHGGGGGGGGFHGGGGGGHR
jgi:hypothetical protein